MNASSVKVELDERVHNPNSQFVMLGSGTSNTSPEITCTCACLPPKRLLALGSVHGCPTRCRDNGTPPPAPPHPLDCDTEPRYSIRQESLTFQEVEVRCTLRPPSAACVPDVLTGCF